MIYVACPYTSDAPYRQSLRFNRVTRYAANLQMEGHIVYSPITHCHPMACILGLPSDWAYWEANARFFLGVASEMHVLMLDGWKESKGVQAEIDIATELGTPVQYVEAE